MCGIAGFAGVPLAAVDAEGRIRAMCDAIRHRGPDSDGYFVDDGIAMGMRRLSIIDVGGGKQPISNEDGTVTVVFNGEIYNHHALRAELEASGHRFATRSDTEVLVHLYEELGPQRMVLRLHGMFAFSIWDARKRTLLIARDRTGMKPLSYKVSAQGLLYCSELRSIWAFGSQDLRVSTEAVMQYLAFGYVPDPNSIFEGVRKLPPGHMLMWNAAEGAKVTRYWNPPVAQPTALTEPELVTAIRERLDHAVASHLESEVPLGAFLSGGLDSSTVVALMARHASGRVRTFSIGFGEAEYDESAAAQAVAAHFATDHTAFTVKPDVEQIFDGIAAMFDEPFADSSAIPTFLVAQLARQAVTVALSGDGGDELFGGYTRYGETLGYRDKPTALDRYVSALGLMLPHLFPGRNYLVNNGRPRWGKFTATVVQPVRIAEGGVASAAHEGGRRAVENQLLDYVAAEVGDDFAASMMRIDLQTYLPGDILTKVDRTSMAVSLEARVPLLDAELVEFALSLPGHLRVTAEQTKRLFRKAIAGIVPDFVLTRPKKGFEVPLGRWFRGPLRHRVEALRELSPRLAPYVDREAVRRLITEHGYGRRDHSGVLWRLIVLDRWLQALGEGSLGRPPALPAIAAN